MTLNRREKRIKEIQYNIFATIRDSKLTPEEKLNKIYELNMKL